MRGVKKKVGRKKKIGIFQVEGKCGGLTFCEKLSAPNEGEAIIKFRARNSRYTENVRVLT